MAEQQENRTLMILGNKVFLSHSPEDAHFARQLHKALGQHGVDCFTYSRDRRSRDLPWRKQSSPIAGASAFITLLSPASMDSYWQLRELGAAKAMQIAEAANGFALIPLVLPRTKPNWLFLWFGKGMPVQTLPSLAPDALAIAVEQVMAGLAVQVGA